MTASPLTIVIGADHAGFYLKMALRHWLESNGWQVVDIGCDDTTRVDYPHVAQTAVDVMKNRSIPWGLLVCGSGVGVSIAANRTTGIRAVTADNATIARLARQHNNANVLCLGARLTAEPLAQELLELFLSTPFEGDRHQPRIDQLDNLTTEEHSICSTI